MKIYVLVGLVFLLAGTGLAKKKKPRENNGFVYQQRLGVAEVGQQARGAGGGGRRHGGKGGDRSGRAGGKHICHWVTTMRTAPPPPAGEDDEGAALPAASGLTSATSVPSSSPSITAWLVVRNRTLTSRSASRSPSFT